MMTSTAKVILLYGNDEFGMARRAKEYVEEFPPGNEAELNTTRLEAGRMSENELNTAVNAAPFLADHRLVILANPSARYVEPAGRKRFEEFLLRTPDTTRLVMCEDIEPKAAATHWLVKWAEKNSGAIQSQAFMLPAPRDMPGWIAAEAKRQGGQIDRAAAAKLAERIGPDTRQASQEIAKLLAYANWSRPISLQDVGQVSIVTAEESIFEFADALALGEARLAQSLLHRLLETEEVFRIWGMVIRQFRLLLQAREILDSGGRDADVQRALGVHRYPAEKATEQARRFTMESLEAIYRKLLEIDAGVKVGATTLEVELDLLVVYLAR